MTIKAPAWCEDAVPTSRGWENPITGEVYKSGGFTPEQIAEFHGLDNEPEVITEVPEPVVQTLTEAPIGGKSLEEMSKLELEALGRTHGIELDRRKTKADLIDDVKEVL